MIRKSCTNLMTNIEKSCTNLMTNIENGEDTSESLLIVGKGFPLSRNDNYGYSVKIGYLWSNHNIQNRIKASRRPRSELCPIGARQQDHYHQGDN